MISLGGVSIHFNNPVPKLQIRGGIKDISKIFFSYFQLKHVVTPHKNGRNLDEMVLMMGHKIFFDGEVWIIIP